MPRSTRKKPPSGRAGSTSGGVTAPAAPWPDALGPALAALLAWFEATGTRGVIIGGVAVSLVARPRTTRDIDALTLVSDDSWPAWLASAAAFGIVPRIPDALGFARRTRVLLLRHASGTEVDVSLGQLPFEQEVVSRVIVAEVAGLRIPLPTPEDLVILKAVAHRLRDVADVGLLLDVHPRLDRRRVRRWVKAFADILDAPEIADDVEKLFRSKRAR